MNISNAKIPTELHNAAIWFTNNRVNIIFLVMFATVFMMSFTAMVNSVSCGEELLTNLVIVNISLTALLGVFIAIHHMGYPPKVEYVS